MPYNRKIPDSPIPGSMLPRASELTLADLLMLIQPGNPIGQRNKSLTLEQLSNFLKSVFEDKLAIKELDILGNEDSTAQIPKVSGWKLVTDTDVTSPTYGQLIVTCETTPGAYPVDKPNVVNFPHITIDKLHATGAATFEKDVTIAADLKITKTLEVMLTSEFHGQVECDEYLISKKGLQSKGMTSVERLNMGSNKSYFGVSTNSSINALLAGTAIDVSVGDIVVLHNTGNSDITVTLGTRQGSGGEETKSTTLKSLCAMQFMCCYKSGGYTHWVPLGNATVTWA